jgi:cell division protein FtsB
LVSQRSKFNLIVLTGILFGIYCFIFGDSGLIARIRLEEKNKNLQSSIDKLKVENSRQNDILKRHSRGEFFKEEASKSGYIRDGEKMLFLRGSGREKSIKMEKSGMRTINRIELSHLKILWIVVSVMVIMLYIIRRNRYSAG